MPTIRVPALGTAKAWRDAARGLLGAGVPPENVLWQFGDGGADLFADAPVTPSVSGAIAVPKSFVGLAENTCWHSDPQRFARLYALLWRLRDTQGLMADRGDADLAKLRLMEKAASRDKHKMKAFLRFREVPKVTARRRFAAWFEPTHHIAEPMADFFARRFGDMDWLIVTPHRSVDFTGGDVTLLDGAPKPDLPDDAHEGLWITYFRNIFNPARLKVQAMQSEMPKKYWKNLPEAAAIPDMIASADARARDMQAAAPTLPAIRAARITESLAKPAAPPATDLDALHRQAAACTRCALHRDATHVVMGRGPRDAALMIVGEQPGDHEDLAGRPFVGPAGQLFDRIAEQVGLDRSQAFVTNAVKHFKFTPRGKRRIHQRPDMGEITACKWWLTAERQLVRPSLILAMGATAAASLTGSGQHLLKRRGKFESTDDGTPVLITLHPSHLLRLGDRDARETATRDFRDDLALALDYLAA